MLLKDLVEGERSKIKGSVHAWGILKRKKGVLPRRVVCSRKVEKNKKIKKECSFCVRARKTRGF